MESAIQTEERHVFPSAINGSMVRVYRNQAGDPCFQDSNPSVPPVLSRVQGAEILKLSEQGRILWNTLDSLVKLLAVRENQELRVLRRHDAAVDEALRTLDQTAATFDHHEPESLNG